MKSIKNKNKRKKMSDIHYTSMLYCMAYEISKTVYRKDENKFHIISKTILVKSFIGLLN